MVPLWRVLFLLSFACLGLLSASCKPRINPEAESRARAWFKESFSECGDDHFSKFESEISEIYVSKYGTSTKKGIMQFKNLSYEIVEHPVTETEKLNGEEWKGNVILKYTQWRYYDGKKWSDWSDMMLVFSDKVSEALNKLLERPNSPLIVDLAKSKGEWSGLGTYWRQVPCSQLPPR